MFKRNKPFGMCGTLLKLKATYIYKKVQPICGKLYYCNCKYSNSSVVSSYLWIAYFQQVQGLPTLEDGTLQPLQEAWYSLFQHIIATAPVIPLATNHEVCLLLYEEFSVYILAQSFKQPLLQEAEIVKYTLRNNQVYVNNSNSYSDVMCT